MQQVCTVHTFEAFFNAVFKIQLSKILCTFESGIIEKHK
jgi:hypothetical protein